MSQGENLMEFFIPCSISLHCNKMSVYIKNKFKKTTAAATTTITTMTTTITTQTIMT